MRKLISTALLLGLLAVGAPVAANASGLMYGALGFMLGSMSASGSSQGGGSSVLYVLPDVSERIRDPLAVRLASNPMSFYAPNHGMAKMTIRQIFDHTVRNPDDFTILEAERVIEPDDVSSAAIWFVYIEKDKVGPHPAKK